MCRKLACFASIVILVGLFSPLAMAQDEIYDFDGQPFDPNDYLSDPNNLPYDPTDWMTSVNWTDGGIFDPFPSVPLPDFGTRVELEEDKYGVNAPVIGPGDAAEAYGIRIGRAGGGNLLGTGLLTMTGGTLTLDDRCADFPFPCDSRLRVGAADVLIDEERFDGFFDLSGGTVTTDTLWIGSGSHGEMTMSGGEVNTRWNFYFDWTGHSTTPSIPLHNQSVLNMTGGTINVGTVFEGALRMHRESSLNLDGGVINVNGSAELGTQKKPAESTAAPIVEIPNVTVSITAGLLEASDFLQVRGTVVLSGGILRADSFLVDPNWPAMGTVEINGDGLLQFNNAQVSFEDVWKFVDDGFFTTSEASPLAPVPSLVDVGGTDFTQVSVGIPGDFDGNGIVNGNDFLTWQRVDGSAAGLAHWETNYGLTALVAAVASVPEPSSVVLALLVSVSMVFGGRNFRGKKVGTNQFS